jgi:hypothetical protein
MEDFKYPPPREGIWILDTGYTPRRLPVVSLNMDSSISVGRKLKILETSLLFPRYSETQE